MVSTAITNDAPQAFAICVALRPQQSLLDQKRTPAMNNFIDIDLLRLIEISTRLIKCYSRKGGGGHKDDGQGFGETIHQKGRRKKPC